jgi:hypothetical protein
MEVTLTGIYDFQVRHPILLSIINRIHTILQCNNVRLYNYLYILPPSTTCYRAVCSILNFIDILQGFRRRIPAYNARCMSRRSPGRKDNIS